MISEFAAWLFALFVIDPLQAEMRERVAQANLPIEAVQQSQQCLATQGPLLLQRANDDPSWATGTAIGVVFGWTSPAQLFDVNDRNCAALVRIFAIGNGEAAAS
jgi:hypothetical protein